ncbi:hypothetical protein CR513_12789, partial [Mucuna pruriens]
MVFHTIYYASHTLNEAKKNYTTTKKELFVMDYMSKQVEIVVLPTNDAQSVVKFLKKSKLCSKWYGPYVITKVFPYGLVDFTKENETTFKVNEHQKMHLPVFVAQKSESMSDEEWDFEYQQFKEGTSLSDHLNEFQGIIDQMSRMGI